MSSGRATHWTGAVRKSVVVIPAAATSPTASTESNHTKSWDFRPGAGRADVRVRSSGQIGSWSEWMG